MRSVLLIFTLTMYEAICKHAGVYEKMSDDNGKVLLVLLLVFFVMDCVELLK